MKRVFTVALSIALLFTGLTASAKDVSADSLRNVAIDEAARDSNFIHAYILVITEGRAFYSVYGHAALRMVCPSKGLDYCFTFEMDMSKSSNIDVLTRKAHAGFAYLPTQKFLKQYADEGRGARQYELNLTPREKQNLWRILDQESARGAVWTFDYTTVNCQSMVLYAINKAIQPRQLNFRSINPVLTGDFGEWIDYVNRNSPWVRLLMWSVLAGVDGSTVSPLDKMTPGMLAEMMADAEIADSTGTGRPMAKNAPQTLLRQTYIDKPCWFTPTMAVAAAVILMIAAILLLRKRKKKRENK